MSVFIVNGAPGVGKSTFEEYVREILGKENCSIFSTVDIVKDIARQVGWDETKTPKNRKFLSDLKDLLTEWNDIPFRTTITSVALALDIAGGRHVVFIDCREPKEIDKLKKYYSCKTILIKRNKKEKEEILNHADAEVENYKYDLIIDNNGSKADLIDTVVEFIKGEKL